MTTRNMEIGAMQTSGENIPAGRVIRRAALWGTVGVLALTTFLDGWFTVEQGYRTVVLRLGELQHVAGPGFHLKVPFIDSTRPFEVRTQRLAVQKVVSYSRDIQQSESILTINYSVPAASVASIFERYGPDYATRILQPAVLDKFKEVFGRYTAAEIVAERQRIGDEVFRAIAQEVKASGVLVEAVQMENIDFTDEFEKAIEAAVKAKAEVTQAEQILRRREIEAQTVVVQAQAKANADREHAKGAADAQRTAADATAYQVRIAGDAEAYRKKVNGDATAYAVKAEGEALAVAIDAQVKASGGPQVAVQMRVNDRWDGKLPTSMPPNGTVPLLTVK